MQYIKKQNSEPENWMGWFTVPPNRRSFDYKSDYSSLTRIVDARRFLILEQNELCAYCQQRISEENASIEHVIPKEQNIQLSTNYFNLVAVCKRNQRADADGRYHCDSSRGSALLPPIIFHNDALSKIDKTNRFFFAYSNGDVVPKHNLNLSTQKQVEAFIELLNLNHPNLKNTRAKEYINAYAIVLSHVNDKRRFLRAKYNSVLNDLRHPYREFLLVYLGTKLGIH